MAARRKAKTQAQAGVLSEIQQRLNRITASASKGSDVTIPLHEWRGLEKKLNQVLEFGELMAQHLQGLAAALGGAYQNLDEMRATATAFAPPPQQENEDEEIEDSEGAPAPTTRRVRRTPA